MACDLDYTKELRWERDYLMKKCWELGIEDDYNLYRTRICIYYVLVFLKLHWIVILMHCIILLTTAGPVSEEEDKLIYVDVSLYVVAAILITVVMSINFRKALVIKHPWIMYASSIVSALILVGLDLVCSVYHYYKNEWITGTFYDTYAILMIYMFFPIPKILAAFVLGSAVSCMHIGYYFAYVVTKYRYDTTNVSHINQISADISHHICLNMLGLFFRAMRDIVLRSSLLDRHQFVMENIWLRNARKQEKVFLHSILPPQIAQPIQDEIRNRIAMGEKHRFFSLPQSGHGEHIMSIQMHPEVTILYADIVNYTHLTTTLSVKSLVALLHDIYARFDKAASYFSVQRIKFLGDCYYCVAGLTKPTPDHARSCVELGLCMINQLREISALHSLNIDIRVGVHSGSIFAGVVGVAKLQYDIWGAAVMIANRLEGTGVPGHIHLSERTLQLIVNPTYTVLPGTQAASDDPFLIKHKVLTFLIPVNENTVNITFDDDSDDLDTVSLGKQYSSKSALDINTIKSEIRNEFQQMPVGPSNLIERFKMYFNWSKGGKINTDADNDASISFYFLTFIDPRLEYDFMRQPDYMLKYSILLAWSICLSLVIVQITYDRGKQKSAVYIGSGALISVTLLLFITWYKKICLWRSEDTEKRYNQISCCLFRVAENIQRSLPKRVCIYMYIISVYFLIISLMVGECDMEEFQVLHIESKIYQYELDQNMCFQPWVLTNIMCLIFGMSLIFPCIPFILKVLVTFLEVVSYMVIIFYQFDYVVHSSLLTNPFLLAEYSHCILILITFLSLYLMSRQTEFNNKMNFRWRVELKKKLRDGRLADQSISILLHNILPGHVVDLYLTSLAKHELYYEVYDMVSVMFATLKNFELDLQNLRVLNEIISEFDKILSYYKDDYLVEKIKIVGTTYMAACGLDVRYSSNISGRRTLDFIAQEAFRGRRSDDDFRGKPEKQLNDEVVFAITSFALDLMRTLSACKTRFISVPCDRELFNAEIRIGISSGEVMAGVVGASQVHYDIWGNVVNMASRMDSTGVIGNIQVSEETAVILQKCGVQCEYRGLIFVKGRGIQPTYFVDIDENLNFQYAPDSWANSESSKKTGSSTDKSHVS